MNYALQFAERCSGMGFICGDFIKWRVGVKIFLSVWPASRDPLHGHPVTTFTEGPSDRPIPRLRATGESCKSLAGEWLVPSP